jgi:metalloendopeptidase OMA1, mitochondrial
LTRVICVMDPFNRREILAQFSTIGIAACLGVCGCRTAPITGRRQLLMMPESKEVSLGAQSFSQVSSETPESSNPRYRDLVQRVGERIAAVARRDDYQWEFKTLASNEQNAFCLPGGKVAVHEGILPVCQTEAGLAVVMSHEIGHAIARHGGERMSQNAAVDGMKTVLGMVTQQQAQIQREVAMKAFGVASQYGVLLPYSRKHELEADHIGVMLMSQAGYDPSEAPRFWSRFGAAGAAGGKPPEFLSTHPSDQRRSDELTKLLPQANSLYTSAPLQIGIGETI